MNQKHGKDSEKKTLYGMTPEPRKTFGTKPRKIINDAKQREALEEIQEFIYNEDDEKRLF